MRILIIGSGPVGGHALLFASTQLKAAQIQLSSPLGGVSYHSNLFSGTHLIYRDAFSGLQPHWHQVIDCGVQDGPFLSAKYKFLNDFVGKHYEFIPYIKRKNINSTLKPQCLPKVKFITRVGSTVSIQFDDNKKREFDYVLICHGALPVNDVLVNSDLAKLTDFVSDHIILRSSNLVPTQNNDNAKLIRIGLMGFLRSYDKLKVGSYEVKKTIRCHFGNKKAHIGSSVIYAQNKRKMIWQLLKNFHFSRFINAMSLRYGFPEKSERGYEFYQVAINDIYERSFGNVLTVNKEKLSEIALIQSELNCDQQIFSGIHYHNTYATIDNSVSKLGECNSRLMLLTPQYDYHPTCHHFTADLMRQAEKCIMNIKEQNNNFW